MAGQVLVRHGMLGAMVGSRLIAVIWPGHPDRWREVPGRLAPFGVMVLRLSLAAVVSYLLTRALARDGPVDLTGPLTALLVLQASTLSTLRMGLVRVGAVLCGVLIAVFLSTWIGLTWWSLGAAIIAAIVVARVLRLREQLLEAPISAMLILGVAHHDVAAYIRVINTLIGAGVGIGFGVLFPTALAAATVARSVRSVAELTAAPLDAAADALQNGAPRREQAEGWLDQARDAASELTSVGRSVTNLRERRRWNPRAIGTSNVVPVLESGLDTFDRSLLAVRALFTAMITELVESPAAADQSGADQDRADQDRDDQGRADQHRADQGGADQGGADQAGADHGRVDQGGADEGRDDQGGHDRGEDAGHEDPYGEDPYGEDLRQIFSVVLSQTADCLRAFGELVIAEAEGREDEAEQALTEGLDFAGETRAMLAELMLVAPPAGYRMLRGSLVIALEHILTELRLENRQRVRQARKAARLPALVQNVLLHPDRPYPRGVERVLDRSRTGPGDRTPGDRTPGDRTG